MTSTSPQEHDALTLDASRQMAAPQLAHRPSRSSGSQCGRRASRIEKPRSTHHSPRVLERRKTTSGTKRHTTLDDHYNMMFGLMGAEEEEAVDVRKGASRPMSWHPTSNKFQVPSRASVYDSPKFQGPPDPMHYASESCRQSSFESEFNSLSGRSSVHPDQQQNIHPFSRTKDHMPASGGSYFSDASWQDSRQTRPTSYALSTYSTPATEFPSWHVQNWVRDAQALCEQPGAAFSDFLPIQVPPEQDETSMSDAEDKEYGNEKELVGMGLYDLPEGAHSWQTTGLHTTGKGLKLEETWQPPESEDADADADEEMSSDDGSDDDPVTKVDAEWPMPSKQEVTTNMKGQSFFFDDEETYTKEWWFHQLKQPTAQDAGLGYGWL